VTPSARADIRPGRPPIRPTWPRVLVIVLVLGLAFVVSRSCQQSQVRLTKEQAIATAERQVDFAPTRTQIRLIRQGLSSHPFWVVSLSVPLRESEGFARLAVVRIDANTGKVEDVTQQRQRSPNGRTDGSDSP
jgi:hypothetical protein